MTTPTSDALVRSAAEAGATLEELAGIYRRIFPGRRAPDWFAQKWRRECLGFEASRILELERGDAREARALVLAGAPPSLGGWWRTSGLGVVPGWRRRGLGHACVAATGRAAAEAGAPGLQTLGRPALWEFYAELGYRRSGRLEHWWAPGRSEREDPPGDEDELSPPVGLDFPWLAEAWSGTRPEARRIFAHGEARAGLSREAGGWLLQWCSPADALFEVATAALAEVSRNTSLIIYGVAPAATRTRDALSGAGWRIAQVLDRLICEA